MQANKRLIASSLDEISYMMHTGDPELVVDDRLRWPVPVILLLTSQGDIGEVGHLEVDVETGQLHVNPQMIEAINDRFEPCLNS